MSFYLYQLALGYYTRAHEHLHRMNPMQLLMLVNMVMNMFGGRGFNPFGMMGGLGGFGGFGPHFHGRFGRGGVNIGGGLFR